MTQPRELAEKLARHIFIEPIRQNFFVDPALPEQERFKRIMDGVIEEGANQIHEALTQATAAKDAEILGLRARLQQALTPNPRAELVAKVVEAAEALTKRHPFRMHVVKIEEIPQ